MRSRPPQEHAFFTKLFDTQLFNKFVEERSFVSANDSALVFFDECTEVVSDSLLYFTDTGSCILASASRVLLSN